MQTPSVNVPRRAPLRQFFIGLLIAVVVAQLIAMVLLVQSQVRTAEERNASDASARVAAANCFESSVHRGKDLCAAGGAPRKVAEVIDNALPVATAANDKESAGVLPVNFPAVR